MRIPTLPTTIPPDVMAELQAVADWAVSGNRDPDAMRKASADMDRIREEIRQTHGVLDVGGPANHELRDV